MREVGEVSVLTITSSHQLVPGSGRQTCIRSETLPSATDLSITKVQSIYSREHLTHLAPSPIHPLIHRLIPSQTIADPPSHPFLPSTFTFTFFLYVKHHDNENGLFQVPTYCI